MAKSNNLMDDITSIFGGVSVNTNPVPVTNNINDIFGLSGLTMPVETKQTETKNDLFMNFGNVLYYNIR
jgi:hypothetical protein